MKNEAKRVINNTPISECVSGLNVSVDPTQTGEQERGADLPSALPSEGSTPSSEFIPAYVLRAASLGRGRCTATNFTGLARRQRNYKMFEGQ